MEATSNTFLVGDNPTLSALYQAYIGAINAQSWDLVRTFVSPTVVHNNTTYTPSSYTKLMMDSFDACPNFVFKIDKLVVEDQGQGNGSVAARLVLGGSLAAGKTFLEFRESDRVRAIIFAEHVFYEWKDGKIVSVKSLLDLETIRKQLEEPV